MAKCSKYYSYFSTFSGLCNDILRLIDSYLLIDNDIVKEATVHYGERKSTAIATILDTNPLSTVIIQNHTISDIFACIAFAHWRCGCDLTLRFYNDNTANYNAVCTIRLVVGGLWEYKGNTCELKDINSGVRLFLVTRSGDPPKRISSFPDDYIISWPKGPGQGWAVRTPVSYKIPTQKKKKGSHHRPHKKRRTELESLLE